MKEKKSKKMKIRRKIGEKSAKERMLPKMAAPHRSNRINLQSTTPPPPLSLRVHALLSCIHTEERLPQTNLRARVDLQHAPRSLNGEGKFPLFAPAFPSSFECCFSPLFFFPSLIASHPLTPCLAQRNGNGGMLANDPPFRTSPVRTHVTDEQQQKQQKRIHPPFG